MAARISKRQIKEDPFIENVLRSWEYVREHQQRFFIALLVVVVAAVVVGWGAYSRKQSHARASNQFADGLDAFRMGDLKTAEELFKLTVTDYRTSQEGIYAQYFIGKCSLESGKYADAIKAFDTYLGESVRHPFFRDSAMEGKAVAYENERRYVEAANTYLELGKNIKMNTFMETTYLKRAADNFRRANQTQRAIEVLGTLSEKATGADKRDLEIELAILKG